MCISAIVCVISLCLIVDYGPSAWPSPPEHTLIGSLSLFNSLFTSASDRLSLHGCASPAHGGKLKEVKSENQARDWESDWIRSLWGSGGGGGGGGDI